MSEPTPSIEQYRESLNMLSASFDDPGMEEFAPDVQLSHALDELAALRAQVAEHMAWRERAEVVLREVTSDDDRLFCEFVRCVFCDGLSWEHPSHKDDCPIVQARTLLGEGGQ